MTDHRVVVTDHDFADFSVERAVLGDIAEIVELPGQEGAIHAFTLMVHLRGECISIVNQLL